MASRQRVAIPEKHLNKIRELKAALAADKTCMGEPMQDMAKPFRALVDPKQQTCSQKREEEKEKQSTVTRSLIENLTEDKAVVKATKDWSGRAIGGYETIEKGKRRGFHHKGKNDDSNGSKGAVVYAGKTRNKDVAFLLAWHSGPYADANNKVYVECGNLEDYINWDEIEKKLDATTESKGHSLHDKTGAALSADTDGTGTNPKLACVLDVMN